MKRIGIVTGSRAEYGLLKPLMSKISEDKELELYLIVTGMHLSPEFGLTYKQIEEDSFTINDKVEMLLSSDTAEGITKSLGLGIIGFASIFSKIHLDILVVLGDRYEILAAVEAAYIYQIPIAHLHGGEITQGAIDDGIRHSITKMSHLHFVSTSVYKNRVIQLGENRQNVHNVGAIGVEILKSIPLLTKTELLEQLNIPLDKKYVLVTYHPVTLGENTSRKDMKALLDALDKWKEYYLIFTKANSDTNGRIINYMIDEYVKGHDNSVAFVSMGQLRYLSALKYCEFIIGNSSSGIIEAPSFHIPTINIGNRQKGRVMAASVVSCGKTSENINSAIHKATSSRFQNKLQKIENPYEMPNTTVSIMKCLKQFLYEDTTKVKVFYDINQK